MDRLFRKSCIFSKNFWSFETSPSIPLGCYIDCSENDQSMGTVHWTVHSHCVERFEDLLQQYTYMLGMGLQMIVNKKIQFFLNTLYIISYYAVVTISIVTNYR